MRNLVVILGFSLIVYLGPAESWNPLPVPLALSVMALVAAERLTRPKQNFGSTHVAKSSSLAPTVTRRDFLRRFGWVGLGLLWVSLLDRLGMEPALAQYYCPCTQTYNHWEPHCGTAGCTYPYRRHHVWQRTCESCDCGCYSYCRTDWCCGVYTCELADDVCDTITPYCGCACNYCNPCSCSHGC
jgi:hypothetical protein